MQSVDLLLQRRDELNGEVVHHKRAIRKHRSQLCEAKGELVGVVETLERLGIKVQQAKGEPYGRKKHS